jgi:hypothetical protein
VKLAKLHIDDVEVKFIVVQKVVSVTTSKVIFTIYDPVDKIILAKRVQHLMLLNFLETTQRSFINFAHFDPNFDL